jgi:hypothetical protein
MLALGFAAELENAARERQREGGTQKLGLNSGEASAPREAVNHCIPSISSNL